MLFRRQDSLRRAGFVGQEFLLLAFPLATMLAGAFMIHELGPHYLGIHSDPDYAYLLNSLNVANGFSPFHTDHPGISLQLIGAAVLHFMGRLQGTPDLTAEVLQNPETCLQAINLVLLSISSVCLLLIAVAVRKWTNSIILSIFAQGAVLFYPGALVFLPRVCPENMMIPIAALWAAAALHTLHPASKNSPTRISGHFWLAFAVSVALATKITFLPYFLAGAILLDTWRKRVEYMLYTCLLTLALLLPAMPHWINTLRWFFHLTVRQGFYGTGQPGLPPWQDMFGWIIACLAEHPTFALILIGSGLALWRAWKAQRANSDSLPPKSLRLLVSLLILQVSSMLMVAKHPANRYLLPALALSPFTMVVALHILRSLRNKSISSPLVPASILAVFAAYGLLGNLQYLDKERTLARQLRRMDAVSSYLSGAGKIIYSQFASAEAYALAFGCGYSGGIHADRLRARYPQFLGHDVFTGRAFDFVGPTFRPPVGAAAQANQPPMPIFFHTGIGVLSQPATLDLPSGFGMFLIYRQAHEQIFLLAPANQLHTPQYWRKKLASF